MANYRGCEGLVKVSDLIILEVNDWNLSTSAAIVDASIINNCNKRKRPGMKDGSGSLTAFYDDTAGDGQAVLVAGAEVVMKLYPAGDNSGRKYATFDAIITTVDLSGAAGDSLVQNSISYEVSDEVVWTDIV